jgi:hypothetical protein
MSTLDRLLNRSPREEGDASDSARAGSAHEDQLPVPDYDRLDGKEVTARLRELSQVELAAVETYERSHQARVAVLNKLRYMRTSEPLTAYDTLASEQVSEALGDADTETVKAVRDYERKFKGRRRVLKEADRVLPTSMPSARENRVREESVERVREGIAGQARTADRVAGRRSGAPATGD